MDSPTTIFAIYRAPEYTSKSIDPTHHAFLDLVCVIVLALPSVFRDIMAGHSGNKAMQAIVLAFGWFFLGITSMISFTSVELAILSNSIDTMPGITAMDSPTSNGTLFTEIPFFISDN